MGFKISKLRTNDKKELEGIWVDYSAGMRVKVARMSNRNYVDFMRKISKPHRRRQRREELPTETYESLIRQAVAKCILLGWENMEDDEGVNIPYSHDKALEILKLYPDFCNDIVDMSSDAEHFREQDELDDDSEKN